MTARTITLSIRCLVARTIFSVCLLVAARIHGADSGGTLDFVADGVNGAVVAPEPQAIGEAVARLHGRRADAAAQGAAGREQALAITWDQVIERLVSHG